MAYYKEYQKQYYLDNAERIKEAHRQNYWANRDHYRNYTKQYNKQNKDKNASKKYVNKYGISLEDKKLKIQEQNNKCLICDIVFSGNLKNVHVDHDHKTGTVRGILCSNCNIGLGKFKDSSEILESALAYLKKYERL